MFKNVIAPIQAWFLSQGRCVGCGAPIDQGKKEKGRGGTQKIVCKCGRIFVKDEKSKKYRRALFKEI